MTHLARPTILVVDPDAATAAALDRRFGDDFAIVALATADDTIAELRRLEGAGSDVALVLAALDLPDGNGLELFARVRDLVPRASRALLPPSGSARPTPTRASG